MYEWTGITVSLQFPISNYNGILQNNDSQDLASPNEELPLIRTGQINYYLQTLGTWLREKNEQHFLIYGPSGSAKTWVTNNFEYTHLIVQYIVSNKLVVVNKNSSFMNETKNKNSSILYIVNFCIHRLKEKKTNWLTMRLPATHKRLTENLKITRRDARTFLLSV